MRKTMISCILLCFGLTAAVHAQEDGTERRPGRLVSFTEAGVLAGNSDNVNGAPFIFHSSLNYVILDRLSAGLGAGVEFLKETHLPVTANVLYQFRRKAPVCPFVRFQTGYLIALESKMSSAPVFYNVYYPPEEMEAKGGWLFTPAAGVIFYTKQRTGIVLSAGYRHQTLRYEGKDDRLLHVEYNRLLLTLGLIF
ncbi:MAG: hypothetical protein LBJ23_05230 [Tannerella sp.]|jgi:hypothetical protein|nr:hypothetical protein [Tannerella sp.]